MVKIFISQYHDYWQLHLTKYLVRNIVIDLISKHELKQKYGTNASNIVIEEDDMIVFAENLSLKQMQKTIKMFDQSHIFDKLNHVTHDKNKCNNISLMTGIIVNIILFTTKLIIGLQFNILTFISDAFNQLADLFNQVVVFIGLKLSFLPPDKKHPYGHGRVEYIANMIVSIFILIVGWNVIEQSVIAIFNVKLTSTSSLLYVILLVSILLKYFIYELNHYLAMKSHLPILQSIAIDARNDILISCGIILAFIIQHITHIQLDAYISFVIGGVIVYSALSMLLEIIDKIIGIKHDIVLEMQIYVLLKKCRYTVGIHDLVLHNYGTNKYFGSVHVEVDANISVVELHQAFDNIERAIQQLGVIQFVIHLDPIDFQDEHRKHLLKKIHSILQMWYTNYDIHDFRIQYDSNQIQFDLNVDFKYQSLQNIVEAAIQKNFESAYKISIMFEYS